MTLRSFYETVASANLSDEMTEKALSLIAGLDSKNEKAKARPRKVDAAVQARKDDVAAFVVTHPHGEFTADEIASELGFSAAQVSAAMRELVTSGKVTKGSRKLDSKHSKVTYVIA